MITVMTPPDLSISTSMGDLSCEHRKLKAVYVSKAYYNLMNNELDCNNMHRYITYDNVFVIEGCPVYVVYLLGRSIHPDFELVWQ